ncbi:MULTISPECIES: hypothetical protein [Mesobacillus]|uniref:Uncharacterized protein n=2 Tax=Mesobacillus TaxID=2675231 RepID=A0A0D6ZDH6_9BACI|nr:MULTISPECIES: hypothetical protein [Mesobacillus]KIY23121.1 hypothetical protein UB32_04520 [Mesobacillus subterraneus]MDQ0415290.1 hypothetical protein [Mesobacillus stamsii]
MGDLTEESFFLFVPQTARVFFLNNRIAVAAASANAFSFLNPFQLISCAFSLLQKMSLPTGKFVVDFHLQVIAHAGHTKVKSGAVYIRSRLLSVKILDEDRNKQSI